MEFISVSTPLFQGNEKKYLQYAIDSAWVSSDGYFVQKFEEEFAKWSGNKYAITVCNGTAALETAIYSLNLEKCSILIPTATIISCALAVLRNDKTIDFCDIKNTLTIPRYNYLTSHAKAIMPVHLFGHYSKSISKLPLIEDCSQYWKPFKVKDVACYSLYANKLITSGEGGIIITNKKEIYERAKSYRNLCHSKERFVHNDIGYNFRMSNLQAAVALAQLEQIDKFIEIKQKNRELYKKYLPANIKILFDVEIPWMYLIELPYKAELIIQKLKERGIDSRRFFFPLHLQPCFKGKYENYSFPNALHAWKHFIYLPSGLTLTNRQIGYICKTLGDIL